MHRKYEVLVQSRQQGRRVTVEVNVDGARVAAEKAARVMSELPDPHVLGLRRIREKKKTL